jgi:hypothetical protein
MPEMQRNRTQPTNPSQELFSYGVDKGSSFAALDANLGSGAYTLYIIIYYLQTMKIH